MTLNATANCKNGTSTIDGIGQGSGQEDITALVTGEDCEATPANFDVLLNYEALEYVSNDIILQVALLLLNLCRCVTPLIPEKEP